jgi:preprotein translocase subunit SecF
MIEIVKNTKIDFIGMRKFSFVLSGLLILMGVAAFVMITMGKANMGIDFAGGAMILGNFDNPVKVTDLRTAFWARL